MRHRNRLTEYFEEIVTPFSDTPIVADGLVDFPDEGPVFYIEGKMYDQYGREIRIPDENK